MNDPASILPPTPSPPNPPNGPLENGLHAANPYLLYGPHPYRPMPPPPPTQTRWPVERTMPARVREIAAAIALVVSADFALWRGRDLAPGGYSAAAFFVAVPLILLAAARARRITMRLGVVVSLLAAIAVRCAYAPTPGTVMLGIFGVFVLAITMRSRSASLADVGGSFTATFTTIPQRLQAFFGGVMQRLGAKKEGHNESGTIAVPVVLVATFIGIFALANPVVAKGLGFLTSTTLPSFGRIVTAIGLAFGAILLVRPALFRSKRIEAADTTGESTPRGLRMSRNALVPLNVVFLAYNVLDAAYLWAGAPPPGMSERQYAHEGAAWLTVALVVLNAVVGFMFRGALAHDPRANRTRIMAYVWLGQGFVLALGTFRRLSIHITTSGLSNLRILGIFGTALVTFGLVLVTMKLTHRRSFTWLARRQLDALFLFLLGFSLLPTHRVSAPVNVSRVIVHEYQALVNVEEQAAEPESAAALLPLLDHDDERIRRGVAALLLIERDRLRNQAKLSVRWADRDLASKNALRDLEDATPRLDAVLGDVDRSAAIIPFEYIRNSSIEGPIAQSEILKVEFAKTRSQVFAKRWADERNLSIESPILIQTVTAAAPGRAERVEAKLTVERLSAEHPQKIDATLVLERSEPNGDWHLVEVRGAGTAKL